MGNIKRLIRCPRCGQQALWQDNPYRPFCSEKCKQIDLGSWASEDYRIAGNPAVIDIDDTEN